MKREPKNTSYCDDEGFKWLLRIESVKCSSCLAKIQDEYTVGRSGEREAEAGVQELLMSFASDLGLVLSCTFACFCSVIITSIERGELQLCEMCESQRLAWLAVTANFCPFYGCGGSCSDSLGCLKGSGGIACLWRAPLREIFLKGEKWLMVIQRTDASEVSQVAFFPACITDNGNFSFSLFLTWNK